MHIHPQKPLSGKKLETWLKGMQQSSHRAVTRTLQVIKRIENTPPSQRKYRLAA